jgi:hypothetical protein
MRSGRLAVPLVPLSLGAALPNCDLVKVGCGPDFYRLSPILPALSTSERLRLFGRLHYWKRVNIHAAAVLHTLELPKLYTRF